MIMETLKPVKRVLKHLPLMKMMNTDVSQPADVSPNNSPNISVHHLHQWLKFFPSSCFKITMLGVVESIS